MGNNAALTVGKLTSSMAMTLLAVLTTAGAESQSHNVAPPATPWPLTDKTLVAWVSPANLTQRGGSVLTLDDRKSHFDGIVFGEIAPSKWMAGSDFFQRTKQDQAGEMAETATPQTLVQVAIVYQGKEIVVYRDGKKYARHEITQPQVFGADSAVVLGLRHLEAGDRACFAGAIDDARIYNFALDAAQIAALKPNVLSNPKPLAWWNFENGKAEDLMGAFPPARLVGKARIAQGRLVLDGNESFLVTPPAALVPRPSSGEHRYESPIHYRPQAGALADTIPFFWKGEYHIFYLRANLGKVPWEHIVSTDMIHWKELPTALVADGAPDGPDGENMFTGCVMEHQGTFHIFYVGQNVRNKEGSETVMHATSPDLITWTKHPEQALHADNVTYRNTDFRDPYVFWNAADDAFWMILCASDAKTGKPVQGVARSTNLTSWQQIAPLTLDPPLAKGPPECPDLFQIGDTWYLIHSPSAGTTDMRYAPDLHGPYRPPATPGIDTPILYAAKRMFDGKRHLITGWIRDLEGQRDQGGFCWGGDQSVPREVYPGPNGQLYFRPIPEALAEFPVPVADSRTLPASTALQPTLYAPDNYLLECHVSLDEKSEFTLAMRQQAGADSGYRLSLRPGKQEGELAGARFSFPRRVDLDCSKPVTVRAFVQGSIIECFVDDAYAFSCRAYDYRSGKLALTATGGQAKVLDWSIKVHDAAQAGTPVPSFEIEAARALREHLLTDRYRPGYHFVTPEGSCMPFDPNGAIFWKGQYHLFYIYQDKRGHNWGHVSSTDLFHWRHHPTGLISGMFSGNCFLNKEGVPTMCYHQVGQGNAMAVALDDELNEWKKLDSNPITPQTQPGDPHHGKYQSWDPYGWLEGDTYYAIFGGQRPAIAKAPTLGGEWTYVGDLMGNAVEGVGINEDVSCADFFKLGDKRMLLCISHRLGARYYLGEWKGEQFHPTFHEKMSWVDNSFFAPESLLDDRGRRIMWAWIFDSPGFRMRTDYGWSGTMSLPRVLTLAADGTLRMNPPEEIARLRYHGKKQENLAVNADAELAVDGMGGDSFELDLEMSSRDARQFGIKVACSPGGEEQTLIYYDAVEKKLKVDTTRSSLGETPRTVEGGPFALPAGEPLKLRVFVDKSVVEVFANEGRQAVMRRIYPSRPDSRGVRIYSNGGAASVATLETWDLMPSNPY